MRKLSILFLAAIFAVPLINLGDQVYAKTARKISHKRGDFTNAQRAKLMEEARKICKAKYGAPATVYQLDYYKWRVVCSEN